MAETVLVIEDEQDVVDLLRYNLNRAGFAVSIAETGLQGLEKARAERPDVIVLDLNLPTLNGLEACRRIKAALPRCPIILITAADDDALRKRAFELGACAFVLKHRVIDELGPAIEDAFHGGDTAARGVQGV